MTHGEMNMMGQLLTYQARITWRQTRILTGEYKKRNVSVGGIQLTDEEKLSDEFKIMERHIDTMQEISDNFFKISEKEI